MNWTGDYVILTMTNLYKILEKCVEFLAGAVLVALLLGSGYMISHVRNSVEKRYGFLTMTPDMQWVPCHVEPIMIRCIKPGGAFDCAGFQDKDIIHLPHINSVKGFHKLLEKPKGTIIELDVIPYDRFNDDCKSYNHGNPEKRKVVAP